MTPESRSHGSALANDLSAPGPKSLTERLAERGVRTIALTWVDNAGVTRVKAVPLRRLPHAIDWGVGMSPVFDVFLVDDSVTTSRHVGGPAGDLRLFPDVDRLVALAAQPGWAWAPVNRRTQDGAPYPCCQRTFAQETVRRAAERGLELRMAFEVEWFVGTADGTPADQGVPVDQFHPEYAPGQLELSVAAADPVAAADRTVLVRQTIRAVSQRYGYQVSFAPVVTAGLVGNGGHLHFSAWQEGRNLFSGGEGRYGLTPAGESVLAGL